MIRLARNFTACRTYAALAMAWIVALTGCAAPKGPSTPGRDPALLAREQNEHAVQLIGQGKYGEAEVALRRALAYDASLGTAHNNLGLVYFETGNLYQAAWEFEEANRLMPDRPEPENNLGLVYEAAGLYTKAIEAYEGARRKEPQEVEYLGNLCRAHVRRGDRDAALRQLFQELVFKETRPEWKEWARMQLLKLNAIPSALTRPSVP